MKECTELAKGILQISLDEMAEGLRCQIANLVEFLRVSASRTLFVNPFSSIELTLRFSPYPGFDFFRRKRYLGLPWDQTKEKKALIFGQTIRTLHLPCSIGGFYV